MSEKPKRIIKCEGRFKELREYIHGDPAELVLDDRTRIFYEDLKNLWALIKDDIATANFDFRDPYYNSEVDVLRKKPKMDDVEGPLSLVPLFPSNYYFEDALIGKYALSMGNNGDISNCLSEMAYNPKFFQSVLEKEPSKIVVPSGEEDEKVYNLAGYSIQTNFGIGTVSHGGAKGGGVRSDSPFILEIYKIDKESNEQNLAAVVGFWAQDNEMLISQMQPCKNAQLPGSKFGVACLAVATNFARAMGFEKIVSYSARSHPIFKEHPENWGQFGEEFVCEWDNSARKLGFSNMNGRSDKGWYFLNLKHNDNKVKNKKC